MQPTTEIQKTEAKELATKIFNKPEIIEKFQAILKTGTNAYIQSALLCIADNPSLMECTPKSLVASVLRSATLGLSLDPALRQGFVIPRWNNKLKSKVAYFQPHYNGLYNLASRTGKYRAINVSPIYEGEQVFENVQTGLHGYKPAGYNVMALPSDQISRLDTGYRDVTSGKPAAKIIGYLGYFKTMDGLEKSVWMTISEIHEHAQKWAPENYNSEYGAWKDPKKRPTMEMKTVFLALTKFMDLSGERNSKLREAIESENEQDDDPITVEPVAQETPSETTTEPIQYAVKDTDLVSPLSQWAIRTAADAWNIDISAANRQLASANLPATMSRGQFKDFVTEGVKP